MALSKEKLVILIQGEATRAAQEARLLVEHYCGRPEISPDQAESLIRAQLRAQDGQGLIEGLGLGS